VTVQVVILAAGLGTRLGRPYPKPLTKLSTGQSILRRQVDLIRGSFGEQTQIYVVVGFKLDLIIEAIPDVLFVYNELFDQTNTSKSLLKALSLTGPGSVLWLNGDVVFEPAVLETLEPEIHGDFDFVSVNTASVADEEVKYRLDESGRISELSKAVVDGLGEAVGINHVASTSKELLVKRLAACDSQDYFEKAMEDAAKAGEIGWKPVDITRHRCMEIDAPDDLRVANSLMVQPGDV
jgi:choline kinase